MLKFKLDENLPAVLAADLEALGHDATSVFAQGLSGVTDPVLLARCTAEGRILLTLDLDFADMRAYPPDHHPGIIVLRPRSQAEPDVRSLVGKFLPLLTTEPVQHRLWMVDDRRVRIRGEQ